MVGDYKNLENEKRLENSLGNFGDGRGIGERTSFYQRHNFNSSHQHNYFMDHNFKEEFLFSIWLGTRVFFIQQGATHKSIFFNDISRERPRRWGSDKRARKREIARYFKSLLFD